MRFYITAFPVDSYFQRNIGIYHSGYVNQINVGTTIEALTEHGYTKCNSFVENVGGCLQFSMHFIKEV